MFVEFVHASDVELFSSVSKKKVENVKIAIYKNGECVSII